MTKALGGTFIEPAIGRPKEYVRIHRTEDYLRPRAYPSVGRFQFAPARPASLSDLIIKVMERDAHDFQTVQWIADQIAAEPSEVRAALAEMPEVRRPVYGGQKFADWYRLRKNGLTRRERRARWRALVTFESMDDDF